MVREALDRATARCQRREAAALRRLTEAMRREASELLDAFPASNVARGLDAYAALLDVKAEALEADAEASV